MDRNQRFLHSMRFEATNKGHPTPYRPLAGIEYPLELAEKMYRNPGFLCSMRFKGRKKEMHAHYEH